MLYAKGVKAMEHFGAFIAEGAEDWQIFQRRNKTAEVRLTGTWKPSPQMVTGEGTVYVRAVLEDTGEEVLSWQKAEQQESRNQPDLVVTGNGQKRIGKHKWFCVLELPEGGLYRIETCLMENGRPAGCLAEARRGDIRSHIGVGDLFVIAGQSNAAGFGRGEAWDPPQLGIHILKNNGKWELASHPLNDSTDSLVPDTYEPQIPGSSPFLSFGRELRKKTGLPVGFLQTAKGGYAISHWKPDGSGELFLLMCRKVEEAGGQVAGVLWYQGCSDAIEDRADFYEENFREFAESFRKKTGLEKLPFFTVQLNRHMDSPGGHMDETWGRIREAQRTLAHTMESVYVVPSQDLTLTEGDGLHTSGASNVLLGKRLAELAGSVLRKKEPVLAPEVTEAVWNGSSIELTLIHVKGKLKLPENFNDKPFFQISNGMENVPYIMEGKGNRVLLIPQKRVSGSVFINGGSEANPCMHPPYDEETGLPVLAFWHMAVKAKT